MAEPQIIITGVPPPPPGLLPPNSRPAPRLPIEELIKNKLQWSLYIQSLIKMKEDDPQNPTSFYQIAAIHGFPVNLPWNGVPKPGIFCVHGEPNFPTWHRPYVMLFEQTLCRYAVGIAEGYGDNEWLKAAYTLRSPYWDWVLTPIPAPEVIELVKHAKLSLLTPKGQIEVDNPLLDYKFTPEQIPLVGGKPATVRTPDVNNPNQTDLKLLKLNLDVIEIRGVPIRTRVHKMLFETQNWDEFSNKIKTPGRFVPSLEEIHGAIHGLVGYYDSGRTPDPRTPLPPDMGHMARVPFAGFDPIFWMHHTMVDRLISLWQGIHPDLWKTIGDEVPPLKPFYKSQNQFYHSSDTELFEGLGYNYPETLLVKPGQDPVPIMTAEVNRLYGDPKEQNEIKAALPAGQKTRLDWFIRTRVPIASIGDTFSVMYFDGPPPQDASKWGTASNFIGSHIDFVNAEAEACENCQQARDHSHVSEGILPLTGELLKKNLYGQPDAQIDQWLREHLQWAVRTFDGVPIDTASVKGLEVAVLTVRMQLDSDNMWRKVKDDRPVHRNVTGGRAGGRGN